MKSIAILFLAFACAASAFTNVQHIQTWKNNTNGQVINAAGLAGSQIGDGTWSYGSEGAGTEFRYIIADSNAPPYKLPYWVQIGGTNYDAIQPDWNWIRTSSNSFTPTSYDRAAFQTPSPQNHSNMFIGCFFRTTMNNTGADSNWDIFQMGGQFGGYGIVQQSIRNGFNEIFAHTQGGTQGIAFHFPPDGRVWWLQFGMDLSYASLAPPSTSNALFQIEMFDATNNWQRLTNANGEFGQRGTIGAPTNTYYVWAPQVNYSNGGSIVGSNWFGPMFIWFGNNVHMPMPETNVIPSDNTYPFAQGTTAGIRGGIPNRTGTTRDVTQAPYSVDKTGVSQVDTGINAAIAASSSNDIVYLPAGLYNCNAGQINLDVAGVEIRGELTNGIPASVLVGYINIGHSGSGNEYITLTNGGWKGSSNLVLSATNASGGNLLIGSQIEVFDLFNSTNDPTMTREGVKNSSIGGTSKIASEVCVITGFNGYTVNISAPLAYYYTNAATAKIKTLAIEAGQPRRMMGVRDMRISGTNSGISTTHNTLLSFTSTVDCYATNCAIEWLNNYAISAASSSHFTIEHVLMQHARTVGTSRSGLSMGTVANYLIHNNVFNDLSIGWQVQGGGASKGVAAYNFYTNITDKAYTFHSAHPWWTLHEGERVRGNTVLGDGYFGSSSRHYVFRSRISDGTVLSKRWSANNQFIRNFLGPSDGSTFVYIAPRTSGYGPPYAIFEDDYPHLGNAGFDTSIGGAPHWPGKYNSVNPTTITNPPFAITQTITTNVIGTNIVDQQWFTNYVAAAVYGLGGYPIIFQDNNNTNRYWYDDLDTAVLATSAGPTNITLNQTITVTNGWKMYMAGSGSYNQLHSNTWTHIRHGNDVITNGATFTRVMDPTVLPLSFPDSMVYSSMPGWFGTNLYPANGTSPIPAEVWFTSDSISSDAPANIPRIGRLRGLKLK